MMMTQVHYWLYHSFGTVWSTTASDKFYTPMSRAHLITRAKPTARQIRALKRISKMLQRRDTLSECGVHLQELDDKIITNCRKIGASIPYYVRAHNGTQTSK
ncbi:hypothetical protein VPHK469_0171 [Vibrio phage K469]